MSDIKSTLVIKDHGETFTPGDSLYHLVVTMEEVKIENTSITIMKPEVRKNVLVGFIDNGPGDDIQGVFQNSLLKFLNSILPEQTKEPAYLYTKIFAVSHNKDRVQQIVDESKKSLSKMYEKAIQEYYLK